MKKLRIPLKGGDEFNCFSTKARRIFCYLSKPGVAKKIKRQYNKRFRKRGKELIAQGKEEETRETDTGKH